MNSGEQNTRWWLAMRLAAAVAALLIVTSPTLSCARRGTEAMSTVVYQGALQVTNNLSEPLQLLATSGSTVLWNGSVAAGAKTEASLGSITAGSFLTLRATNSAGAIVSARDSVPVQRDTFIWIIP